MNGAAVWLSTVRDAVRTQLWPLPALAVMVALVLGAVLPILDASVDDSLTGALSGLLFAGGADAARTVLSAIAGSLITVTSLTFSLTVVTLQLASSQFSPRLLRTFTRDRWVHVTLSLFLATFTFALTVLRSVRNSTGGRAEFVPQVSVTLAFGLAVASVLGLVAFLAHLARQIRVETMLRSVYDEATSTLRLLVADHEADASRPQVPAAPVDAVLVLAHDSGFLVRVDQSALTAAAIEADVVVVIDRPPGSFLVTGTPIGCTWPLEPGRPLDRDTRDRLSARIAGAVDTGFERTAAQDIGFALRQLTDVATKALSPGINDPTTAIHALGHSAALLCELVGRDLGPRLLTDDEGRTRVVLQRPTLADLVELAVAQPRRYGAADPAVLARLFGLLRELAWCARPDDRHIVRDQLARLRATAMSQDFDDRETAGLGELADQVDHALDGRWPADHR